MPTLPHDLSGRRIVRTDSEIDCPDIDNALREAGAELILVPGSINESALAETVADADLLLMCYTPITARVIHSAQRLLGIVKYGVGIDAIDIDAAMANSIPVVNVPDYAEQTVAEGAFCLLLALAKRLIPVARTVQQQGWIDPEPDWLGNDIAGKNVALIGVGRIGRTFARMAGSGFGARVIGYDPGVSQAEMQAAGVEKFDDLHALLAEADVVSIHCVLNNATHALLGPAQFAAMVRKPILINVSRGAIVDEQAMLTALDTGQISAAGLDVYSKEPLNTDSHALAPLFGRDNVVLLPHLTFYTHEAMLRLSLDTLNRCAELLTGQPVRIRSTDPRLRAQSKGVCFMNSPS